MHTVYAITAGREIRFLERAAHTHTHIHTRYACICTRISAVLGASSVKKNLPKRELHTWPSRSVEHGRFTDFGLQKSFTIILVCFIIIIPVRGSLGGYQMCICIIYAHFIITIPNTYIYIYICI
jgi:hypothetical protein